VLTRAEHPEKSTGEKNAAARTIDATDLGNGRMKSLLKTIIPIFLNVFPQSKTPIFRSGMW
jgi:hypothetical protein